MQRWLIEPPMVYLLDSNVLIEANKTYFPLSRFMRFWRWIEEMAKDGLVLMPKEMYFEILVGSDQVKKWISDAQVRNHLLLDEEISKDKLEAVLSQGYGMDLSEDERARIGNDAALISYAMECEHRTVVTKEVSSPGKVRANRRIPDVCRDLGVNCINDYKLYEELDFRVD